MKIIIPFVLLIWFVVGCKDEVTTPHPGPSGTISTIMGTGLPGFTGDGDLPEATALYYPLDIAFDTENRLVVIDWNNLRLRRVDHDGRVRTILGTGQEADTFVVNGTPALETPLHHAFSLALDSSGEIFLAGNHVPLIWKIDTDMRVWVVAGNDHEGYAGDGGPALDAEMNSPSGVAVAPGGFPIYIADTANHSIRRVDADSTIHAVGGNGTAGYAGDGGPASQALFRGPFRVRLEGQTGNLLVTDTGNHCIRRIDASGKIETIAGTGTAGYTGDGGPATKARLSSPYDARMGPDGRLYIADTYNHCIRCVDATGVITTVAGNGTAGFSGDGGPANEARLSHPFAMTFDPDGNLLIADTYNSVIRRVEHP